jgi:hypothetical protein
MPAHTKKTATVMKFMGKLGAKLAGREHGAQGPKQGNQVSSLLVAATTTGTGFSFLSFLFRASCGGSVSFVLVARRVRLLPFATRRF